MVGRDMDRYGILVDTDLMLFFDGSHSYRRGLIVIVVMIIALVQTWYLFRIEWILCWHRRRFSGVARTHAICFV